MLTAGDPCSAQPVWSSGLPQTAVIGRLPTPQASVFLSVKWVSEPHLYLGWPEGQNMTLFKQTELCRALDTWQTLVSDSESESVGHSVVSDSL